MRKLITTTFVTLDGVMQAPGGPEEDTSGNFEYGGWTVPYFDDAGYAFMRDTMGKPFDLLLGRKTYDIFASYWPKQESGEIADPLNRATKYVASRGKPDLSWEKSNLIEGDVIEGVRRIKAGDGPELQVHGSGNLIQTLLRGDVIDEMRVLTFPAIVGSGKKLFEDGAMPHAFNMTKTVTAPSGVIMTIYQPAGDVKTGSF